MSYGITVMVIIMLMATRHDVMDAFAPPRALWTVGWLGAGAMTRPRWR